VPYRVEEGDTHTGVRLGLLVIAWRFLGLLLVVLLEIVTIIIMFYRLFKSVINHIVLLEEALYVLVPYPHLVLLLLLNLHYMLHYWVQLRLLQRLYVGLTPLLTKGHFLIFLPSLMVLCVVIIRIINLRGRW